MSNIIQGSFKQKEDLAFTHSDCGGQLFYVIPNPNGVDAVSIHRCFKCGQSVDLYGLFYNADGDDLS